MPVITATNGEQARRSVDTLDQQGSDFIKTLSTLVR
jgi:hypothetical protein